MKRKRLKIFIVLLLMLMPLLANSFGHEEDIVIYEPIENEWINPRLYVLKKDVADKSCTHGTFALFFGVGGLEIVGSWSVSGDTLTMTQHMDIWFGVDDVVAAELPDDLPYNRQLTYKYLIQDSLLVDIRGSETFICRTVTDAQYYRKPMDDLKEWSPIIGVFKEIKSTENEYLIIKRLHYINDTGHFEIYNMDTCTTLMGTWDFANDTLIFDYRARISYNGEKFGMDTSWVDRQFVICGDTIRAISDDLFVIPDTFVKCDNKPQLIINSPSRAGIPCPVDTLSIGVRSIH